MTGTAYKMSARIAAQQAPSPASRKNREPMLGVVRKHRQQAHCSTAARAGRAALRLRAAGTRRSPWASATATATPRSACSRPGTIGFMMDCDTTGIEPDIALVKYKKLVGGGVLKIVNGSVPQSLERLGYPAEQNPGHRRLLDHNENHRGRPGAAARAPAGVRLRQPAKERHPLHPLDGPRQMMAAVQPFLSGAISKSVNHPNEASVEDIEQVYRTAWKLGLKAHRRLPRRLQAHPAGLDGALGQGRAAGREGPRPRRWRVRPCPTSAAPSPISSRGRPLRAT
jgi:ribonucleoside-diphosphate reductase alpha chain